MSPALKKLEEQVIVVTGATSGIGLATARKAAQAGARVVLVARDADALDTLAHEMRQRGAEALTVAADVGDPADVARIAREAVQRYGRVDTWINNAGASVYGNSEQVALADMQRVMQTNLWGCVNGSLEAVKLMKAHGGGAIINLGSEVSDRAIPLQGTYAASKHAIKAFTESLRMELDKDKASISVTLIKPSAIATPFAEHAKNYMDQEPALPPPNYAPELVADAILHAAVKPERELFVGGHAKAASVLGGLMPRAMDRFMRSTMFDQQQSDKPSRAGRSDALHAPDSRRELRARNRSAARVSERSPYTTLEMQSAPVKTALLGGVLLAVWALAGRPGMRKA
ncbi:SDR family oxidoreductase [uncultured Massilia sp.]|uniref:SDR family oxidoreductase n=1 Tax=uncultured Massilia sp. TaxID=169973 RepID=UPI0025D8F271|nr:SDR family oxidoreductase [uncultured Massilia sp.]